MSSLYWLACIGFYKDHYYQESKSGFPGPLLACIFSTPQYRSSNPDPDQDLDRDPDSHQNLIFLIWITIQIWFVVRILVMIQIASKMYTVKHYVFAAS